MAAHQPAAGHVSGNADISMTSLAIQMQQHHLSIDRFHVQEAGAAAVAERGEVDSEWLRRVQRERERERERERDILWSLFPLLYDRSTCEKLQVPETASYLSCTGEEMFIDVQHAG
jgi:hypothetical protein